MAQKLAKKENAQARSRTGGSKMATLNFTAKPLALIFEIVRIRDQDYVRLDD